MQRWKIRDKCLRVATYYRVMHLEDKTLRVTRLKRLRQRFQKWALTFCGQHREAEAGQRTVNESREGHVSANTRRQRYAPNMYLTTRRNKPRKTNGTDTSRRRVRLATHVDSEIGIRLYGNMCNIAKQHMRWRLHDPG